MCGDEEGVTCCRLYKDIYKGAAGLGRLYSSGVVIYCVLTGAALEFDPPPFNVPPKKYNIGPVVKLC